MTASDLRAFANPNQVDPARIAEALDELWREADVENDGGVGTTRACGLTLIAVVSGDLDLARAATLIAQATAVVPARTLLVDLDDGAEGGLTAEVSALCSLDRAAGKTVCQEQVLVKAAPARFTDVAPLLSPLLIADLPVVLWLPEPRLVDVGPVKSLLPVLDLLVTDSAAATDARALDSRLIDLQARERLAVRDLAFARLRPWRMSAAEGFDALQAGDRKLARVIVDANAGDAHGSLLLAWIESRLARTPGGRDVVTELRVATAGSARGLAGLGLVLESSGPDALRVEYRGRNGHVCRVDSSTPAHATNGGLPMPDDGDVLTHVLCNPRPDREHLAAVESLLSRRWSE